MSACVPELVPSCLGDCWDFSRAERWNSSATSLHEGRFGQGSQGGDRFFDAGPGEGSSRKLRAPGTTSQPTTHCHLKGLNDQPDIPSASAATWPISCRTGNYQHNLTMKLIVWGLHVAAIWSSLLPTTCAARDGGLHLKVTGKRNQPNLRYNKRGNVEGSATLSNSGDTTYYTNVTLGGAAFSVLIGMCDLLPL